MNDGRFKTFVSIFVNILHKMTLAYIAKDPLESLSVRYIYFYSESKATRPAEAPDGSWVQCSLVSMR